MGVMVYVFMNLSLFHSSIISPIILGSQLAIPFGIIASAFLLNENISKNKWLLILTSFIGILIIFFDPKISDNFLGLFYASLMALFFGLAQAYSRQLKEINSWTSKIRPEPPKASREGTKIHLMGPMSVIQETTIVGITFDDDR